MDVIDFSNFFTTKAQKTDFVSRLASISDKIYHTDFNLETSLLEQFGMDKKDKFLALLNEQHVSLSQPSQLKPFFSAIIESINKFPTLSLVIAFEPTEKTLKVIADWFILNLKKQVVFDIKVYPQMIGGAAISFQGKHRDFSVKPVVDTILQELLPQAEVVQAHAPQQSLASQGEKQSPLQLVHGQ